MYKNIFITLLLLVLPCLSHGEDIEQLLTELGENHFDRASYTDAEYHKSYAFWLGVSNARIGKYVEASAAFGLAYKVDARLETVAKLGTANVIMLAGKYAIAENLYSELVERNSEEAKRGLILALIMQNKTTSALKYIDEKKNSNHAKDIQLSYFISIATDNKEMFEELGKQLTPNTENTSLSLLARVGQKQFHIKPTEQINHQDAEKQFEFINKKTVLLYSKKPLNPLEASRSERLLWGPRIDIEEIVGWGRAERKAEGVKP
jgi:hypothetical protein